MDDKDSQTASYRGVQSKAVTYYIHLQEEETVIKHAWRGSKTPRPSLSVGQADLDVATDAASRVTLKTR